MSWIDIPSEGEIPCQVFVELLTDYLEGALPADLTRRVEEHAAVCGKCLRYLEQLRATIALAGRLVTDDADSLPDDVRTHLMQAFQRAGP